MKNWREELMRKESGEYFGWTVRYDGDNFRVENEEEGFTFSDLTEVIEHLEIFED